MIVIRRRMARKTKAPVDDRGFCLNLIEGPYFSELNQSSTSFLA